MKQFIWTTDIHLDRLDEGDRKEFAEWLAEQDADAVVISGDIGEGDCVASYLRELNTSVGKPIYFVLGNHDFYQSTFIEVRDAIRQLVNECESLHWLSESGIIHINETTAMIGHEGWGDGRNGDYESAGSLLMDFRLIKDFAELSKAERLRLLNTIGDKAADYIKKNLLTAFNSYQHVYLITHVPPFREACLDRSLRICDDKKLPFYTCKAVGDILLEIMNQHTTKQLTVLCGHSHEACDVRILDNLRVRVKDAGYGSWYTPSIVKI